MYYLIMEYSDSKLDARKIVADAHERFTGQKIGDTRLFVQFRLIHGLMMDGMSRQLASHNLSTLGYITMMLLNGVPENMANPSDMCRWTGETRANMTRICDELVAKGWLRRVQSEKDRRRVELSLTEEGMQLLHTVVPKLRAGASKVFSVFTDEEKDLLAEYLVRLQTSMESNFCSP